MDSASRSITSSLCDLGQVHFPICKLEVRRLLYPFRAIIHVVEHFAILRWKVLHSYHLSGLPLLYSDWKQSLLKNHLIAEVSHAPRIGSWKGERSRGLAGLELRNLLTSWPNQTNQLFPHPLSNMALPPVFPMEGKYLHSALQKKTLNRLLHLADTRIIDVVTAG